MVLTPQEESLIDVIRQLPPSEAGKVFHWAQQLGQLAAGASIQWSDSWTEEDFADATRAALKHFERDESECP